MRRREERPDGPSSDTVTRSGSPSFQQDHSDNDPVLLSRVEVDRVFDAGLAPELKRITQQIQHALTNRSIRVVPELETQSPVGNCVEFGDYLDVDLVGGRPVPNGASLVDLGR
jgi:peptidoglycan hydrolase-like protein with peptidoglycan-binding domain